ncbi:hypothetical protein Tfer_2284 [Thermincola ferriacetica]|uniref:Type II secretion system F domain-containing protein n=1 Tax=Thermincola ferriacetica TaxID=281456 RepID=A0A0L6W0I5_9FIRM|nr:hypothetical protein Tfer_2284 [Thermincola ferriacetica]
MKPIAIIWSYILPVAAFLLTIWLGSLLFAKDRKVVRAILKAGDITLSEYELQRRKDGKLVSLVADFLPKIEKALDLQKLFGYDLRNMLKMMGEKKKPERLLADHIVTAVLAGSVMLVLPLVTGFELYFLLYPVAIILIMVGQAQMVKKRFKAWQNEVVKDIPELIDKMRISLASGKDYLSALKKVQENSGPRLSKIVERLINDMQIMRPAQALDEFAQDFGLPVMVKFVAALKVGMEVGYEQAESYFANIEDDIRDLRKLSLEELTKNKPEKVVFLKGIMIAHALAALALTAVNLFSNVNKIF